MLWFQVQVLVGPPKLSLESPGAIAGTRSHHPETDKRGTDNLGETAGDGLPVCAGERPPSLS